MIAPTPLELAGEHVSLVPLAHEHATLIREQVVDDGSYRHMMVAPSPANADAYVASALERRAALGETPFAVLDARDPQRLLGSTRYLKVDVANHKLEIGSTWYRPFARGTVVNPECKLLLLRHAFSVLGTERVTIKTDALNEGSRRAILAIGATFEGILRRDQIRVDGRLRDTAWYSVIASDWPAVEQHLIAKIGARPEIDRMS